jgi:putative ABC transport system substrate-binding protein
VKIRIPLYALAITFAIVNLAAAQQPKKIPHIGYLGEADPALTEAFRQGLRELGYIEGKNIAIEYRNTERKRIPLAELASELVRLKVDVIVTGGESAFAAKNATNSIPIVFANSGDPVATGLVGSLARPGGNITGLTSAPGSELWGKRLELLKDSFPKVSRVAVLWNPDNPNNAAMMKAIETVSRSLDIKAQSLEIRQPSALEQAFSAVKREHAEALATVSNNIVVNQLKRIVEFAATNRLSAIYGDIRFVAAGGLMSYGANFADLYRRSAVYIDKILKGSKPADLPVEQPTKFELVINLKTAKQIGVKIPQSVLYRADKVIR